MPRQLDSVTAYVSPQLKKELESWADEERRTLSNLISYVLETAVQERNRQKQQSSE